MPKRKAVRPMLESMENRLVLSAASALDPTAAIRSAITALFPAHHSRAAADHSKSVGTAHHQHATKVTHAAHHQSSTTSSSGNNLSNFFKSVFPGL
jgi:hypothetical protein